MNADDQIYKSFLRISLSFRDAQIRHPAFMVNFDQTQVVYHLGGGLTFDERGTKQVSVLNHEEKRAFTLTVGISGNGDLLPFHSTFKGKSNQSLPKKTAAKYDEAKEIGFIFSYSKTDTYWATAEIVKLYISEIVVPYWNKKKEELGCLSTQECILQIDVWAVHRSQEIRDWLHRTYPWIIIEYVPGGCTGIFQGCDVGIQRVLKLSIKRSQHQDIVIELLDQLDNGVEPDETRLDTTLGTLRDRCVDWLVTAYKYVNKPEIVKKVSVCARCQWH